MPKLTPTAIIASWINEERTRGYQLQANGDLIEITRSHPREVWSPPDKVAKLSQATGSFESYLAKLTH